MTTSDAPAPGPSRRPGVYARAENASRRVLLIICIGALTWGVGSLSSVNLHEALEEPLRVFDTGLLAIIEHWFFQHLWLLIALAPASWVFGRFLGGNPILVVLPAAASGEALGLALPFLSDGSPFESWADVAGWAVSYVLFLVPCVVAFVRGERGFERARAQSLVDAAARKAEYDAFIANATAPATEAKASAAAPSEPVPRPAESGAKPTSEPKPD